MLRSYNQSYSGKTTSGREAFRNFVSKQYAGDYTQNKTNQHRTVCGEKSCIPKKSVANQSDYLLRKKAINNYYNDINNSQVIKTDLNYGLVSKMVLSGVSVIKNNITDASPTTLNQSFAPSYYTIDPSGNLFGNNICGINNFENYAVYNEP